jgi:hypothetical protein
MKFHICKLGMIWYTSGISALFLNYPMTLQQTTCQYLALSLSNMCYKIQCQNQVDLLCDTTNANSNKLTNFDDIAEKLALKIQHGSFSIDHTHIFLAQAVRSLLQATETGSQCWAIT